MLWVISEVYYPEETGTGYYITGIAEHLASILPVSVLCAQPAYSKVGVRAPGKETHQGVKIVRCPSIVLRQKSILARLVRMVSITLSIFVTALFRVRSGDAMVAVTNPPSVPMVVAILSWILRVPYSLIVHDVYPDMLAACGLTTPKAISYRTLLMINRMVLRRAQDIYCIGRDMAVHLAAARGRTRGDGIHVIPLWSDCEEIFPTPRATNPLLLELGLAQKKLVVLYAGNMGHPHGVETLASAIKQLEVDPEIHFLFIGSGNKLNVLEAMVKQGAANLTILPSRPRSAQREFLNACDVAILSLVPGMLGLAVPSRTYNLMAAGKPIIALVAASSEVAQVVREEEIGWVVEPGHVDGAIEAILAAKNSPSLLLDMSARARRAAKSTYSPANGLRQFDPFFLRGSGAPNFEELQGAEKS